jgi:hypothetical protein
VRLVYLWKKRSNLKCELKKNANVNAKPVNAVLSAPVNAARILAAAENILVKLKGPETLAPFFILGAFVGRGLRKWLVVIG